MGAQELRVQQVNYPQSATAHLVFIRRTDAARGGANLHPAGSILRRQFDHAVIGQNDLRPIADKQIAIHLHAGGAQFAHFFQERDRIQHHAVADHSPAAFAQHSARH